MADTLSQQIILVVDDEPENIDVLGSILHDEYEVKVALNGEKALQIADSAPQPDLILLDIMMPAMDGYEVCKELKANPRTAKIPVIFVTGMDEVSNETRGFSLGAVDFITKPVSPAIVRARVKTHLALYDQNRILEEKVLEQTAQLVAAASNLKASSLETILRLTHAAEYKDEDTGAHIQRMSNFAAAVARRLGLNEETVECILYAAPMHDVGKIGIPDRILLKPAKLDDEEWNLMKQHTLIGGKILQGSQSAHIRLGEVIALTHHEKWDGSGYPYGLKGSRIPLAGRIVAIADVFDALTSARPYKEPFSLEKSFAIIREGRGGHFDPKVVDAFFAIKEEILAIKDRFQDATQSPLIRHSERREGLQGTESALLSVTY